MEAEAHTNVDHDLLDDNLQYICSLADNIHHDYFVCYFDGELPREEKRVYTTASERE